jgi:hypothetical protein
MITRVIYDTTGLIISQMQGSDLPVITGVPYLEVEIPDGKYIVSINMSVTPNIPIYEDLPKSDLQKQVDDLTLQVAEAKQDNTNLSEIVLDLALS